MARVTIEDCLDKVDSRFALVHLAVRRVLQLRNNAPSLIYAPKNKEVVVALREIAAGRVHWDNIKELEEAKGLPDTSSKAREESTRRQVEEIVEEEAAPKYDAAAGFEEVEADASGDEE
jgi:DNA-directed RNA polymerase subunit omega